MPMSAAQRGLGRREFMSQTLAWGGMAAVARVAGTSDVWAAVAHRPLDPVNPDILFGSTSSLWSNQHDIEWAIKRIAALGLAGDRPYANQIEKYRSNPLALKKLFDEAGITMIDVSNGAKDSRPTSSIRIRSRKRSRITWRSRAIFSNRSAPPIGSATWAPARPAARATIS